MPKTQKSSGEDMNPTQRLMLAAQQNKVEMCKKIFNDQMNNDISLVNAIDIDDIRQQNALLIATRQGNFEVITWLISLGVDLDIKTISGANAFHLAAREGYLECVMALKVAGANIFVTTDNGEFPLYSASWYGHCSIVSYLLKIGCDINQVNR